MKVYQRIVVLHSLYWMDGGSRVHVDEIQDQQEIYVFHERLLRDRKAGWKAKVTGIQFIGVSFHFADIIQ